MNIEVGTELTIDHQIISSSGAIAFNKGHKVTVRDVVKIAGNWSYHLPDIWIPEKILGVKLEDEYGIWFLSAFTETKNMK
jgi:hypothetical protein